MACAAVAAERRARRSRRDTIVFANIGIEVAICPTVVEPQFHSRNDNVRCMNKMNRRLRYSGAAVEPYADNTRRTFRRRGYARAQLCGSVQTISQPSPRYGSRAKFAKPRFSRSRRGAATTKSGRPRHEIAIPTAADARARRARRDRRRVRHAVDAAGGPDPGLAAAVDHLLRRPDAADRRRHLQSRVDDRRRSTGGKDPGAVQDRCLQQPDDPGAVQLFPDHGRCPVGVVLRGNPQRRGHNADLRQLRRERQRKSGRLLFHRQPR